VTKRNIRFIYAESRKTTKFIELCATFMSFVVKYFLPQGTQDLSRQSGRNSQDSKNCADGRQVLYQPQLTLKNNFDLNSFFQ
jgi:hypothetical protein